jgi:signal transduction histidine kinase
VSRWIVWRPAWSTSKNPAARDYTGNASHRRCDPLAVIVGHLGLIEQGGDVAHGIGQAQDAASRIRDIVQHMVRITRLEASADWPASQPKMLGIRRSAARDNT